MSRSISAAATAAGRTSFGGDAFHGFVLKDGTYTTVAVSGSTTTLILSITQKAESSPTKRIATTTTSASSRYRLTKVEGEAYAELTHG